MPYNYTAIVESHAQYLPTFTAVFAEDGGYAIQIKGPKLSFCMDVHEDAIAAFFPIAPHQRPSTAAEDFA